MSPTSRPPPARATITDAILWLVVPLGALWWLHVGGLSGDGVAQSSLYTRGTWAINPNHLLYEPIGSAWLSISHGLGDGVAIDQLKRLSFLGGALTAVLFRLLVAPRIATTRSEANIATAWIMAPAAVLGLLLSDETQIIQLPSLVLMVAAIIHYAMHPTVRRAVLVGAAGAVATLFYISNALTCAAVVLVLGIVSAARGNKTDGLKAVLAAAGGGAAVLLPVTFGAWYWFTPRTISFGYWLTSYGGGRAIQTGAAGYGTQLSAKDIGTAAVRAVYGAANALVDVSGAVSSVRDTGRLGAGSLMSVIVLLVCAGLVVAMVVYAVRNTDPTTKLWLLPLVVGWTAGVVVFAIYWNNSDDQFFFQLAIPLAVTAAVALRAHRRPVLLALALLVGWNGYRTAWRYITYPRDHYVAALTRESNETSLLIFPGDDEVGALLSFVPTPPGHRRLAITTIADRLPARKGVAALRDSVMQVLQHRGTVSVVSIIDAPADQNPWKYLRSLGYEHSTVNRTLSRSGTLCQRHTVGAWPARWIVPEPIATGCPGARGTR